MISQIARRYDRSEAQIILRWIVQKEVSAGDVNQAKRLKGNLDALDFTLSAPDMAAMNLGQNGLRIVDKTRMPLAPDWD